MSASCRPQLSRSSNVSRSRAAWRRPKRARLDESNFRGRRSSRAAAGALQHTTASVGAGRASHVVLRSASAPGRRLRMGLSVSRRSRSTRRSAAAQLSARPHRFACNTVQPSGRTAPPEARRGRPTDRVPSRGRRGCADWLSGEHARHAPVSATRGCHRRVAGQSQTPRTRASRRLLHRGGRVATRGACERVGTCAVLIRRAVCR